MWALVLCKIAWPITNLKIFLLIIVSKQRLLMYFWPRDVGDKANFRILLQSCIKSCSFLTFKLRICLLKMFLKSTSSDHYSQYRVSHSERVIYRQWIKVENEQCFIIKCCYIQQNLTIFDIWDIWNYKFFHIFKFCIFAHDLIFQKTNYTYKYSEWVIQNEILFAAFHKIDLKILNIYVWIYILKS